MRVRHAGRQPARLMLLLHGWTGDENSMWVFVRNFTDDYWIAAPRAPHQAQEGGYSWRILPPKDQPGAPGNGWGLPAITDLQPAAESLLRLVDNLSGSLDLDATRFDIMGFSQGGALVIAAALLFPQRIRKAAVLAGFMPAGAEVLLARQNLVGTPFFVAHGSQDPLIPLERAMKSVELLEQAGAQVTFCQADVGHKVSAECMQALKTFFHGG